MSSFKSIDDFGPLLRQEAIRRGVASAGKVVLLIDGAKGYFIGSGVVEAGCKTLIGGRCNPSGMFWSESGAENMLALRCIHSSRSMEEFRKPRLNQRAARNDALPLAA